MRMIISSHFLRTPYIPNPEDSYNKMSAQNLNQTLSQLLSNSENRIQSQKGDECIICYREYNTLDPSTGAMECEIRLPCNHSIGSVCLVTWLREGNSCPMCRERVVKPRCARCGDAAPEQHQPLTRSEYWQGLGAVAILSLYYIFLFVVVWSVCSSSFHIGKWIGIPMCLYMGLWTTLMTCEAVRSAPE